MSNKFSVVIVCKNEAGNIERVLSSIASLADEVLVYDTGSTDETIPIVKSFNVQLHQGEWKGYGKSKQVAVNLARNNWVLSLDADEAPDEQLKESLRQVNLDNPETVYELSFKNFLGDKHLRWGEWGEDKHIRLFNRQVVNWDDAFVHERLVIPPGMKVKKLKGHVLHRTMNSTVEYSHKMVNYALLNAEKYFRRGRKASWFRRYINPLFSFLLNYIIRLGFLDGREGFLSAYMTSFYTFLKYARLHELWQEAKNSNAA